MITMGEITLGNWAPPSRRLMANISQWWGLFILIYRCVLCLALVNVTNAVFIAETNRVALDNDVAMMRKRKTGAKNAKLLEDVFQELDESGDGFVSVKDMTARIQDERMRKVFSHMDLEVEEVSELLFMMSDGKKQIDKDQFIKGILALKGDARSSGQTKLLLIAQAMAETLDRVHEHVVSTSVPIRDEPRRQQTRTTSTRSKARSTLHSFGSKVFNKLGI
uniref:EF-hand domain-containing protein n=1 Tax=Alexandrium andersonii TaxID=327968 RepID=A0A7S2GDT6_9DINO|mmetsp:Transcript_4821/g.10951  ORF Transcript_4821/g.10951 Transcript_4821/m.10951 type:complete len:221 (+) Transcript_4821:3-665(+)